VTRAALIAAVVLLGGCATTSPSKVVFPAEATIDVNPQAMTTGIYRPPGEGLFPAVVLLHTCGGMGPHITEWARRLLADGYAVVVVDSFTPRGVRNNCTDVRVSLDAVAADAFAALQHLKTVPAIAANKVAVVGFSFGGGAALRAASVSWIKQGGGAFRAVGAFYPACGNESPRPEIRAMWETLYPDTVTPVRLFLGDLDDETPPRICLQRAQLLADHGRPVTWRVYPDTTHAFDSKRAGNPPCIISRGFHYCYNAGSVEAAWQDLRAFLAYHLR
jgi:dienelactone hydrolase